VGGKACGQSLSMEAAVTESLDGLNLYKWWDPADLALAVGPSSRPKDGRIIADHRYQKHLEAWIASHFALVHSRIHGVKEEIKMVPDRDRTPDAILRITGDNPRDVGLEITVVLIPGRPLRREYKEKMAGIEKGMQPVRFPDPETVAAWIDGVLEGKARSGDPKMWLIVYLNAEWVDESDFAEYVSREHLSPWEEVHVLNSGGRMLLTIKGDGPKDWVAFDT
jgi:hypothetical protein